MIEENEEVKNVANEETDAVEEIYDIVLEGTLNYKIFIKDDKYKFEANVTPESEFIMIENTITALNQVRQQWPMLKKLISGHPDKEIRKQAKESLPTADQRMRIDAAVYELEKIRDRIIWGIYQNAKNPVEASEQTETE